VQEETLRLGKDYHTVSEYRYRMELVRKSDPPDEDREIFAVRSPVSLTAPASPFRGTS
jgi:hypothetical protein